MTIKYANYIKSSALISQCPEHNCPEYAFIGRSNVGKSSLINMLTGNKRHAKTSATPGKTLLINHFEIHSTPSPRAASSSSGGVLGGSPAKKDSGLWYLVDLPGYGFAKRS